MALILMKEASFSGASVAVMTSRFLVSGYLNYIMLAVTVFTVYTGISYLVSNWRIYLQKPLEGR
jgi:CDP-diacylglycerol--glycerol-3-phosphate 3-phosphatidyltransferase